MKRNAAFLVIALFALIAAVVLCILLFTGDEKPDGPTKTGTVETSAPTAPPASAAPVTPAPPRDDPPGTQPAPATAAPATQTPTEASVFETREPLTTEEPEPTPEPILAVNTSGSFTSDTGTYLNLLVEWSAAGEGETVPLHVRFSAQSYSLYTVAAYGNLQLTVNGKNYYGDCPAINVSDKELTVTPLTEFTVEVPRGNLTISAVWHYKGSYSGKDLPTISASGEAFIG